MSQEDNDFEKEKRRLVQELLLSRLIDLPNCTNEECEFFGTRSKVNYAFSGGGNICRCYHCHVVVQMPINNSV